MLSLFDLRQRLKIIRIVEDQVIPQPYVSGMRNAIKHGY
jgi:hypothetical protein